MPPSPKEVSGAQFGVKARRVATARVGNPADITTMLTPLGNIVVATWEPPSTGDAGEGIVVPAPLLQEVPTTSCSLVTGLAAAGAPPSGTARPMAIRAGTTSLAHWRSGAATARWFAGAGFSSRGGFPQRRGTEEVCVMQLGREHLRRRTTVKGERRVTVPAMPVARLALVR